LNLKFFVVVNKKFKESGIFRQERSSFATIYATKPFGCTDSKLPKIIRFIPRGMSECHIRGIYKNR